MNPHAHPLDRDQVEKALWDDPVGRIKCSSSNQMLLNLRQLPIWRVQGNGSVDSQPSAGGLVSTPPNPSQAHGCAVTQVKQQKHALHGIRVYPMYSAHSLQTRRRTSRREEPRTKYWRIGKKGNGKRRTHTCIIRTLSWLKALRDITRCSVETGSRRSHSIS